MQVSDEMLIDRVDASDTVLGTIARRNVFKEKANFRVAHVFVFNDRGELLLQKISSDRQRFPGSWGSSVAGYLFSGESYEQAAARRTKQELGVSPRLNFFGKTSMTDEGCTKFIGLFTAEHNGPFRADPTQVETVKFFPMFEVEQIKASQNPTFAQLVDFYNSKKR